MPTAIIVDSTSYLPEQLLAHPHVYQVTLSVTFEDGKQVSDLVSDDKAQKFYDYLSQSKQTATTSQPPIGEYMQLVQNLVDQGYERILAFHLSSAISGTYQTAVTVLQEFKDQVECYVYDTKAASVVMMALVETSLSLLDRGMAMPELDKILKDMIAQSHIYLTVEDLTYLSRGGRLKNSAAIIGNLFAIKPILFFNEAGEIVLLEKVRTRRKLYQRLAEIAEGVFEANPQGFQLYFAHALGQEVIDQVVAILEEKFGTIDYQVGLLGPVVATHVGIGSCGMATVPKLY
ncbi:DegV family protein [Eremococcus coleocola]|uniref:DegV family protein n=1 Tax=Eremococcus coleocola TaxID=88132 RepID=UPI000429D6DC|nr:DegV family protein [Eremococcus coleocola]